MGEFVVLSPTSSTWSGDSMMGSVTLPDLPFTSRVLLERPNCGSPWKRTGRT